MAITVSAGIKSLMQSADVVAARTVLELGSSDTVTFGTTNVTTVAATNITASSVKPASDDGAALGDTTHNFSDLHLATGAVINYQNGNFTVTHSTGLLTFSGPITLGTSNALTCGTIELGAASDTTISRSGAGKIAVEGKAVPLMSGAFNLVISGPTAARTMTTPDADFTTARTDAANTFTGVQTMTAPVFVTKMQIPTAAGSSTLSTGGDTAYNTTNKLLGIHNGTKEVGISTIQHGTWAFDPAAVNANTNKRLFLMSTDISEPFGIHIVKWKLSFAADPTTEIDMDLKRADAFIGVANAAVMDVLDTANGASSEATSSNINSDAVVATSKVIYLELGTAYSATGETCIFEMWWEVEED